jgi:hypothetical protein
MSASPYRYSRPVVALGALTGPIWLPLLFVGFLAVDTTKSVVRSLPDLAEVIGETHREAKKALRWSIVDPIKALFVRAAGQARTAAQVTNAKVESLADRVLGAIVGFWNDQVRQRLAALLFLLVYPVLILARFVSRTDTVWFMEDVRDDLRTLGDMLAYGVEP